MLNGIVKTIDYIETNLQQTLCLDRVAGAVYYSKYHLHRAFTDLLGIGIYSYIQRRRLTEAARLLAGSQTPILQLALDAGYESQQAFSKVFKAMYKQTPHQFRRSGIFYPLQLPLHLAGHEALLKHDRRNVTVKLAIEDDIPDWMELVRLVVDGFPFLQEDNYLGNLRQYIGERRAVVMKHGGIATGVLLYSGSNLDFFAVHPFFRKWPAAKWFLYTAAQQYLPANRLTTTTYRCGDKADVGTRVFLSGLGFREEELLEEFGYPTQRFVIENPRTA